MKKLLFSIAFLGLIAVNAAAQNSTELVNTNPENGVSVETENAEEGVLSDFLSQVMREHYAQNRRWPAWSLDGRRNALGLKEDHLMTSISFQRILNSGNRLELNVGRTQWYPHLHRNFSIHQNHSVWGERSNLFDVSGLYQWGWCLNRLAPGFNIYVGVGAGVFFGRAKWRDMYLDPDWEATPENLWPSWSDWNFGELRRRNVFEPRVMGNIGFEYNFNFPLQLAIDFKPSWSINRDGMDFRNNVSLAARWRF